MRLRVALASALVALSLTAGPAAAMSGRSESVLPAPAGSHSAVPGHRVPPIRSLNPAALRTAKQNALHRWEARHGGRRFSASGRELSVFGGLAQSGLTAS